MKRWLLLSLLALAVLLLSVAVISLRSSDEAQAGAVSGDPVASCAADDGALVTSVDGASLTSSANAALAADCYFVALPVFENGCGNQDLWIMRYLCYTPQKGWYYVNYFFCRENQSYHAVAQHSGGYQCLSVMGTAQDEKAEQFACSSSRLYQQFDIIDTGGGWYQLKFKHSGMCLDVPGSSHEWGEQLIQWPCHGGNNQKFSLPANLRGIGQIVNKATGLCLDVADADVAEEADIVQWGCSGKGNQQWSLHNDKASRLKTTYPDRWYHGATCSPPCDPLSWMTLPTHRYVGSGLAGLWDAPITNAIASWNATDNTVYLTESTPPSEQDDISVIATQDGCWDDWGRHACVAPGGLGHTFWLGYNKNWVCPSEGPGVGISCTVDRPPTTWWYAIVALKEQAIYSGYSTDTDRAFVREAVVAHELGHAIGLKHDNSAETPEQGDLLCGVAPLKKTIMDYDCMDPAASNRVKAPQPWDSCGVNHLYYDPNWRYSGC